MEPKIILCPNQLGHRNEGHKVRHCHFAGHGLSDGGLFTFRDPKTDAFGDLPPPPPS